MDLLKEKITALPKSPGVYQFYDKSNTIIYIGKAKNLRSRVASYFTKSKHESYKTNLLSKQVRDIKHIVVDSESDALLLENNLIKKFQPKYNILLKDDKTFPWICIKNESFPRIFSTRKLVKDGSEYFGPYTSALMVKTLITLVRQIFQIRTCGYNLSQDNIQHNKFKRCLEYHIGNCQAPCEGLQNEEDYFKSIDQVRKILKGNIQEVLNHLHNIMSEFAKDYKFEEAEKIKNKIGLLEHFKSKSTIVNPKLNNIDVFSFIERDNKACVNFLKIINGAIVQSHSVELQKKLDEDKEDLLLFAILDIREKVESNSKELLVPFIPKLVPEGLNFSVPKVGDKKKLIELSERNAKQFLLQRDLEIKNLQSKKVNVLEKLQSDLQLKKLPKHIECFDNSNIQGSNPVAACVVFKNGKPTKTEYRHFNIKTVEGPNDFASMEEVVYRRYKRMVDENKDLPQLIVIDGGKGQLSAAVKSLKELNLYNTIPVIGIAKRLEEIYFPNDSVPIYLDKNSPSLKLIQNLRNEAHRFGITFHRQKRSSGFLKSKLEEINGVGEQTVKKLITHFGSVEKMKASDLTEIEKVVGRKLATKIWEGIK